MKIEAFFATEDAPEFTAVEKSMYMALSSPQNSYKFPVIRSVMEQAEKSFLCPRKRDLQLFTIFKAHFNQMYVISTKPIQ